MFWQKITEHYRLWAAIVFLFFQISCGGAGGECVHDIATSDYNTSGLRCTKPCDCSNLKYEGYCINSTCVSTMRSPAQRKGEIRSCKLLQKVGACEWGQQEAQPEPLKEMLWGNCLPPTIAPENTAALCSDGKDNDCNGTVDDKDPGCKGFCVEGRSEPCYRGEKATLNQGSCRVGFRTCQPNGGWGTCEGEVVPKAEVCNAQDDDCNGLIDDGLVGCHTTEKCLEGSQKPCYTEPMGCVLETLAGGAKGFRCVGGCQTGTQRCVGGLWGLCEGAVSPSEERCDGVDNNCDGKVDEICACQVGEQRLCFLGPQNKEVGVCKAGTQQCKDGVWGACDGAVAPSPETCDGQDNDCNGLVDDEATCPIGQACSQGSCQSKPTEELSAESTAEVNVEPIQEAVPDGGSESTGSDGGVESLPEPSVEAPACSSNETLCVGGCVDTRTNSAHCGGCSKTCKREESCQSGACVCVAPYQPCGTECINPNTNDKHCGGCGKTCAQDQVCQSGSCILKNVADCEVPNLIIVLDRSSSMRHNGSGYAFLVDSGYPCTLDSKCQSTTYNPDMKYIDYPNTGTGSTDGSARCLGTTGAKTCRYTRWDVAINALIKFVDSYGGTLANSYNDRKVRFGLVFFSNGSTHTGVSGSAWDKTNSIYHRIVQDDGSVDSPKVVKQALIDATAEGGTNYWAGLDLARNMMIRSHNLDTIPIRKTAIFFVTDGDPSGSNTYSTCTPQMASLDPADYTVKGFTHSGQCNCAEWKVNQIFNDFGDQNKTYVVGFGNGLGTAGQNCLNDIAHFGRTKPKTCNTQNCLFFSANSASELSNAIQDIIGEAIACLSCPMGQNKCRNQCVDSQTDGLNCGGCGRVCVAAAPCVAGVCQLAQVSTVAGVPPFRDGKGTLASFSRPNVATADGAGHLYVAEQGNLRIRKIDLLGNVTTIAGDGHSGFLGGVAAQARFTNIAALASDGAGTLYIADEHFIRKLDTQGVVSTLSAGQGYRDGLISQSLFNSPRGLVFDKANQYLYVADTVNHRIRRMDAQGNVVTVVGNGTAGYRDGLANQSQVNSPTALALDTGGHLFFWDHGNFRIRKLDNQGIVSSVAGSGSGGFLDGSGLQAQFKQVSGLVFDGLGNLYITDEANLRIRKMDAQGKVTTVAGNGSVGYADGTGSSAIFRTPTSVAVDLSGNLYITDKDNDCVRMLNAQGKVTTFVGEPVGRYRDGLAVQAQFERPTTIALDPSGNLWIAEQGLRLRKLSTQGNVSTVLGNGTAGFQDGAAAQAQFRSLSSLAFDRSGNLYIADTGNHRIRKLDSQGNVSTAAGVGTPGYGDGKAHLAFFNNPGVVAVDSLGNVYIADNSNFRIRKMDAQGNVSTVAGDGAGGFLDGAAAQARFQTITALAFDPSDNLYLGDFGNYRIRKLDTQGNVTTVAGSGKIGFLDGLAAQSRFGSISSLVFDAQGNLYIADTSNHRIRLLDRQGRVMTVVGENNGFRDGAVFESRFYSPSSLALDVVGNLYIADRDNHLIRLFR